MNGTYGFAYSGSAGIGFGVFTLRDGALKGYDSGGARYSGTAKVDSTTSEIVFSFDQILRGTSHFVQGMAPLGFNRAWAREMRLPADFASGKPHEIELSPGVVNVMFKQIADALAPFASGFLIQPN